MCRSADLKEFLDLGHTALADGFLTKEELNQAETFYPLKVLSCQNCGYAQLSYLVPGEILYCKNYPYESSTTASGRKHFYGMAESICKKFSLGFENLVLDVGSNVGVLLSGFKEQGVKVLGLDPAQDIARKANEAGIETVNDFFTEASAQKILAEKGKLDLITSTNSFAHMPDAEEFVKAAKILLNENGVIAIEAPYFVDLIENLEYDTIYHEHLGYVSVKPLTFLFEGFEMEIFDVEKVGIHGGSLRIFVGMKGKHEIKASVAEFIAAENQKGIYDLAKLREFAEKVKKHKEELIELLRGLKKQGKRIAGLSAPAKGNTLLNYCHINTDILDFVTEKAQIKVGLYTPGTHIPVLDDSHLLSEMPDYALILAWNFAEEIMNNLNEYKNKGGRFIIPVPNPRII